MKKLSNVYYKSAAIIVLLLTSVVSQAQIDVDIDLGKQEWYEDPKVWAGVAVFMLLLVLIARKGKK